MSKRDTLLKRFRFAGNIRGRRGTKKVDAEIRRIIADFFNRDAFCFQGPYRDD
jgi:hypothetical protein